MYRKVTEFKKHGIKVTLALGGWNDSKGDKYSRLVNNPAARARFIEHAIKFIEKHDFDGLDLDWEYPSCWQVRQSRDLYKKANKKCNPGVGRRSVRRSATRTRPPSPPGSRSCPTPSSPAGCCCRPP